jgi:O-antigen biosynthesis protein
MKAEFALTVAVITCDRPESAADLVRRLLDQAQPSDRIIVVDDARPSQRRFDGVDGASLVSSGGIGAAGARNAVPLKDSGGWTLFLDDDVVAPPDLLNRMRHRIESAECDVITGNILSAAVCGEVGLLFDERYPLSRGESVTRFVGTTGTRWSPNDVWRVGVGACMAWRNAALTAIGGFPEVLGQGRPYGGAEDLAAFRSALLSGYTILYDGELKVRHYAPRTRGELVMKMRGYGLAEGAFAAHVWGVEQRAGMTLHLLSDIAATPRQLVIEIYRRMRGRTYLPLRALAAFPLWAAWGFLGYRRLAAPADGHP